VSGGARIVLTADRTLMSRHRLLLDGMFVSSQTTAAPRALVSKLFLPPVRHVDGQAQVAPLGLRRLQAALLRDGFSPGEVAIADADHLHEVCGPDTRLIGISSGEPAGFGMSSSTMAGVVGGTIYPQMLFEEVRQAALAAVRERSPQARLALGGPGAWQLAQDDALRERLGFQHVIVGYGEDEIAGLARAVLAGEALPALTTTSCPAADRIPPVLGETTMGAIELSRGCGLGCDFCTLGGVPMRHLPEETIFADADVNLRAGQPNLSLLSEDLLRYGATGVNCQPEAALGILRRLRELPGLRLLQADHTNIASVAQYDEAHLQELHYVLGGGAQRHPWLNLGIETASGELLERLGGRAKMHGVGAAAWADFCREQLDRLMQAGFVPMVSLVLGSPAEAPDNTRQTLQWVRALRGRRVMVFPVIYAPLDDPRHNRPRLTKLQWQVMREAYELNFRWVPVVYGDSMRAGGVGSGRRLAIQLLGQGNVHLWRTMMRLRQHQAERKGSADG
jgi:radical SAM superfamily enzyme YgiQ (UPF0313 family)